MMKCYLEATLLTVPAVNNGFVKNIQNNKQAIC